MEDFTVIDVPENWTSWSSKEKVEFFHYVYRMSLTNPVLMVRFPSREPPMDVRPEVLVSTWRSATPTAGTPPCTLGYLPGNP